MLPGTSGFHWTPGHVIFLSLFFLVVITILTTVLRAIFRSARDLRGRGSDQLLWQLEFEDLPDAEKRCRHEIAGRVNRRTCPNAFDCRNCKDYERFAALPSVPAQSTFGLDYPSDRLYHRGHTWVRPEAEGAFTVGLDDLALHLLGKPDSVELPPVGTRLTTNSPAWRIRKGDAEMRVRAPLDGEVVETAGEGQDWCLKIRPETTPNLRHLLRGPEVSAWLGKELERLQIQLGAPDGSPSLADGGILMSGLMDAMPKADWDTVLAGTFLET